MKILVNDKEIDFPSSLSDITLGQRIAFHNQYGIELNMMMESIQKMEEGPLKELELLQFSVEKMIRTFAFFADTTVDAVKESKFLDDIASIYYSCLAVLIEDEKKVELQPEYLFKGELWEIAPPELKNGSKMKFGEFIDAKQLVKDMSDLGKGKWESMLPLCAIYLRKQGEPYKEEFLYEDSERLKLMKELPMDIAMSVGFFLTATMNFSINILRSSEKAGPKEAEKMLSSTLTGTAG